MREREKKPNLPVKKIFHAERERECRWRETEKREETYFFRIGKKKKKVKVKKYYFNDIKNIK